MCGRGHNRTSPRRIILSITLSKRETTAYAREVAQAYQAPEDHTLHFDVQRGERCSIKREGGGTTVPDPVGTYPRPSRQTGDAAVSRGRERAQHTRPRKILPSTPRQSERNRSIKRGGGGTTVPDPVESHPLPCVKVGETTVSWRRLAAKQVQTP